MQWITILLPSFVSVALSEKLEKKSLSGTEFVKCAGLYALFTNLLTVVTFQYILKLPTSIVSSFENNLFLIHYLYINIFFAVVLPIVKVALNPHLRISIEKRKKKEVDTDEEA